MVSWIQLNGIYPLVMTNSSLLNMAHENSWLTYEFDAGFQEQTVIVPEGNPA